MNDQCYQVDTLTFQKGLLDKGLDAVYILLLKGSDRTEKAYSQIHTYKLSKNYHVIVNPGYKKCEKKMCDQKPYYDLMDANVYAMKHADKMGYENVMILEDDYVFDDRIRDPVVISDVVDFWKNRSFHLYSLGSINIIQRDIFTKHPKIIHSGTTHSMVFSREGRSQILREFIDNPCLETPLKVLIDFKGHDLWYNFAVNHKYAYYKPLCYQTFPHSENRATWDNYLSGVIFRLLKLETQVQPGWDILYIMMYILNILFVIFIVKLVIKLI
tara:strand:+ start:475 stop:1287 length:813 start_codon:yes stop_codon:yes gene_type:complete